MPTETSNSGLIYLLRFMSRISGIIVIAIGCLVLLGWILDVAALKSLLPGLVSMKANTAIAFIFSGFSLVLLQAAWRNRWWRFFTYASALFAGLLGLLNLGEYLIGRDFGIDQLLFMDLETDPVPPGRMAITTALSFVMVGFALPLLAGGQRARYLFAQSLAIIVDMLAMLSLMGYAFGVEALYDFGPYSAMALNTALTFAILGTGILGARPEHGLMATFTSNSAGGFMARRLLPAVLIIPFVLGWLVLAGQRAGLYDPPFGAAVFAMLTVTILTIIVFFASWSLQRIDVQRLEAEQERSRLLREVEDMAEDAKRRAVELQSILDNMVDGVFVCDAEGRIAIANKAGARLLGMASVEDVKRTLAEFPGLLRMRHMDEKPYSASELPLTRALAGEIIEMEDMVVHDLRTGSERFLRASSSPIKDETGAIVGAVSVARDVTEIIELERLKDEFLTVAAHELKTPVTGIKGYAQLLLRQDHVGRNPDEVTALQAINRQSDKISRLVNDLLQITEFRAGPPELELTRFDLSKLVASAVERVRRTTARHKLVLHLDSPVLVKADRDRIEQVLINLLDNAVKYSPKGGDVDIRVRIADGEAVVSIQDHGVGIPKEKQARIFERFYRAHTGTPYDYGGMGVGLYISKQIIDHHSGRMCFESEEGKGATFYFTLPIA